MSELKDKNHSERGFRHRPSVMQMIKLVVASLIYILWVIWVGNPYLLLLLPLIIDIYYTKFINWTFWKRSNNKVLVKIMEWVDAVVFSLSAVYLVYIFLFQNYQIPTSSLEKSLLVGDFLFVSKATYGPRIPNTPIAFPLAHHTMPVLGTKSYTDWPNWGYKRLKGLKNVERDDIVVFNFPAGDTVAMKKQDTDFYTLSYIYGSASIRRNPGLYGEVVYRPVDRRENYVKRCVGLPGDTLQIIDNQVIIDGTALTNPKEMQQVYFVETTGKKLGISNLEKLGISYEDIVDSDLSNTLNIGQEEKTFFEHLGFSRNEKGRFNPIYRLPLTSHAVAELKSMDVIRKIVTEPGLMGGPVYPLGNDYGWTKSDYGPIWIPRKGASVELTPENIAIYGRCIKNYECNSLEVIDGVCFINGVESSDYTFSMDYYWMMGDNRDKSADSRSWGFVPEDHIVGQPIFVWVSFNKDKGWMDGKIRFNRIFMNATNL